ncbi:MAG TPA: HD domain-containing protein [Chloroflexota bacterium]|nr:HD domain-containing protein [Chloroflexota bacterium]
MNSRHIADSPEISAPLLARELAECFRRAGHELYLIGGSVRDLLLGRSTAGIDLDFATSATPDQTDRIVSSLGLGKSYRVGERYGTIGLVHANATIEITTFRKEVYPDETRKPRVSFGTSLLDDLERRDFTINAIALDPLSNELIDPLGGLRDMELGLIRAVGTPSDRFREDPLRLLRAIRFATALEFEIESQTWTAMSEEVAGLRRISRERIRDEYTRMLEGSLPSRALTLLRDSRAMAESVPELLVLTEMKDHGPRHPLSLWDHTMRVVDAVPPILAVRWAAVLHDIAKPTTRTTEPSGRPRFFHHEDVGAEIARTILEGLRYSNSLVDAVTLLVETHMQLHSYSDEWSDGAVRRLMLRLGPQFQEAIALARADGAGHSLTGRSENAPRYDRLEERVRDLGRTEVAPASPLSGDDLMQRYARPPGPWIRRMKDALRDAVIDGTLDPEDRDAAWRLADSVIAETR